MLGVDLVNAEGSEDSWISLTMQPLKHHTLHSLCRTGTQAMPFRMRLGLLYALHRRPCAFQPCSHAGRHQGTNRHIKAGAGKRCVWLIAEANSAFSTWRGVLPLPMLQYGKEQALHSICFCFFRFSIRIPSQRRQQAVGGAFKGAY